MTGLLYPYGNENACAGQIGRLVESEQLRRELAQNAEEAINQYSLEQVLPVVWAQYAALAELEAIAKK